jgi:hypothetical protein
MRMDFTFTFAPDAVGTLVHAEAEIAPRGWLRPVMDREFASREPALKRALEGKRAAGV